MESIWNLVQHERAELVRCLRGLSASDWSVQSQCPGWSVHDVAAHLLNSANTTPTSFAIDIFRARFNIDRQNQDGVDRYRNASSEELLEQLQQAVDRRTGPPRFLAPIASRLVEEIAHGEDIRRPLGINHSYEPEALKAAIVYQAATRKGFGGAKEDLVDVRLVAEDLDWTHGSGTHEVRGPALEILMAVTGRTARPGTLSGSGVSFLK
ncbi:maleylpyruvate isomerase family mycothiol-dependent enzyme [Rothia sp. LK2492]|uniref:maleylpyruvate isomerase family mycothiol-dependent enzyme n=1 Tax=Rothia sp. LK2492 TaxID=3114370 RepID=UPI0034CE5A00